MEALSSLIRNLALDILRALEGGFSFESVDALIARAEMVLKASVLLIASNPTSEMETCVATLQGVVYRLNTIASSLLENHEPYGYHLPVAFTGERGRPKIVITEGMLDYLLSNGFSATSISMLLQVSLSTLRPRMREHGMTERKIQ